MKHLLIFQCLLVLSLSSASQFYQDTSKPRYPRRWNNYYDELLNVLKLKKSNAYDDYDPFEDFEKPEIVVESYTSDYFNDFHKTDESKKSLKADESPYEAYVIEEQRPSDKIIILILGNQRDVPSKEIKRPSSNKDYSSTQNDRHHIMKRNGVYQENDRLLSNGKPWNRMMPVLSNEISDEEDKKINTDSDINISLSEFFIRLI